MHNNLNHNLLMQNHTRLSSKNTKLNSFILKKTAIIQLKKLKLLFKFHSVFVVCTFFIS